MAAERSNLDNYDVFINFRGADTRRGFVDQLYDALVSEGIRVFVDDEELTYRKRLDEELPQAINNSKIYITIISETYASSKWCLRELAQIVRNKQEFKEKKEILPVFYKIKTDDVKLKTDLFKDQLNSLINKNVTAETVQVWAEALRGIPNLKTWTVPIDGGYQQDGECCRDIVKRVSIILRVKHKPLPKVLTGMEDPIEKVMQLLDIGNPDFQVIGILGMGGSGKTTLAKAVYNKICDKFDSCCFLPDVRESFDKDKGSSACLELQKKILKEVSYGGDVDEIRDVEVAVRKIQLTLQGKKVLMVFDDVENQILRLIGDDYTMFGRESRVIITTRDDRVLRNREFAGFTKIHMMKVMENEDALELFSWNAFGEPMPPADYVELSKDAVSLTGRLPLSLEITGSLFFMRGRKNWKQTVEKLKKMPNKEVQERLKISYEDLEEHTKEIFLDIACFFVNHRKSHEVAMWDECGFYPELAIEELMSMCLVKIDEHDIYRMHDHIKDLGREIVRQEGPKYIEHRSRIWRKQDSIHILTSRKKKNNKIEGIILKDLERGEVDDGIWNLSAENFVNLDKLRFLHVAGLTHLPTVEMQVEGSVEHLLPNLRLLSLQNMKMMRFNVTNFNLKKLVVLNLSCTNITESWVGWKEFKVLRKLKVLHLISCFKLQRTPVFLENMSLEILDLCGCEELEYIDTSIGKLQHLTQLNLRGCKKLKRLPDCILGLEKLEVLDLSESGLQRTPVFLENMPLKILNLSYCKEFEYIHTSIGKLQHLTQLNLSRCKKLKKLPDSVGGLGKLENLYLYMSGLQRTPVFLENMPLKVLTLSRCYELEYIDTSIGKLHHLTQLNLRGCVQLKNLPNSIGELGKLEDLDLSFCERLVELPQSLGKLHSLRNLNLSYAEHLPKLPDLSHLQDLNSLWLDGCQTLTKIPDLVNLKSLRELSIEGCESREILEVASRLKKLHGVEVRGIPDWYVDNLAAASKEIPNTKPFNSVRRRFFVIAAASVFFVAAGILQNSNRYRKQLPLKPYSSSESKRHSIHEDCDL